MASIQIPDFNRSLGAFSSVIRTCAIIGVIALLSGIIWIVTSIENGELGSVSLAFALSYLGSGLIGLAIAGSFLRHTAKVIVEGLGGTISIQSFVNGNQAKSVTKDLLRSGESPKDTYDEEQEKLAIRLSDKKYRAWLKAGEPDLRPYFEKPDQDFFDWLLKKN